MRLEADGKSIDDVTKGDLMRALPKADMAEGWSLLLERSDDDSLEAEARLTGGFSVTHVGGDAVESADAAVDLDALRTLFEHYFDGRPDWKKGLAWKTWPKPSASAAVTARPSGFRPGPAVALLIAGIAVAWSYFGPTRLFPALGEMVDAVPLPAFLESPPARMVAGFGLVVFLFFLFALIVAMRDVRRMRRWTAVPGRITRSEPAFELRRASSRDLPNNVRVARIAYEYSFMGARRFGTRVNADKIVSPEEAERMLRDYPVGKTATVYCNPQNPTEAVLERDPPKQLALGCSVATLMGIALIAAVIWLINIGPERLVAAFPNTLLPVFIPSLLVGIVFLGLFVAALRQRQRFSRFQTTRGTVVSTFVKEFKRERERRKGAMLTPSRARFDLLFMPVVEYRYSVAGKEHLSRSIRLSGETSGSKAHAESVTAKYPSGGPVNVYYDPEQPDAAALQRPSSWFWILLVPVLILFWLAWRFSGLA